MSDGKNYQIANLIAQGGTAVLYKAIQTSLDRVVAVKKLHHHLTQDENFTRRFILEAKAAASLDHENIVKIIDFGVEDETYFMVMEFIEGESFREILDKWKQIPPDAALAVVHQVCQGLEHAHSKGIVHRDVKPGNIMLTRTGKVKITDFGLAKLTQAPTQHTAANSILGTPLYMSPEQAFGESVDDRSDLFSLGTMLYESLTGQQPFHDDNYMGVIQNIINQNAPHPSKFDVELESDVQSILGKAMNKNRDARFQGAGDFKKAIENYMGLARLREASDNLKGLLATDGATIVLPKTERVLRKKQRFRKGLAAALTAVGIAGAAATGYMFAPDVVEGYLSRAMARFTDNTATTPVAQQADMLGGLADAFPAPSGMGAVADSSNAELAGTQGMVSSGRANGTANATAGSALVDARAGVAPAGSATGSGQNLAAAQQGGSPSTDLERGNRPHANSRAAGSPHANPQPAGSQPVGSQQTNVQAADPRRADTQPVNSQPAGTTQTDPGSTGSQPLDTNQPAAAAVGGAAGFNAAKTPPAETQVKVVRKGWLAVSAEPSAEIYIDGRYVADTPAARIEITSGSHTLECKAPKHEPYLETIKITAGELSTRNIVLTRLSGRINLSTIAGAEVYVDGVLKGMTPLAGPIELDVGQHQITVKKAGYHVWNNIVSLEAKQILPLKITLSPIY